MDTRTNHEAYLAEVLASLNEEKMSAIDFDLLKSRLTEMQVTLSQAGCLKRDLEFLRQDYIGRISGMAKAMAVASDRTGQAREANELIESLAELSVEKLVQSYRTVSSRFRTVFPASFGLLGSRNSKCELRNLKQYK